MNAFDKEYATYYLVHSDDMKQIMLTVDSTKVMNPQDFIDALQCFINEIDDPNKIFDEHMECVEVYQ